MSKEILHRAKRTDTGEWIEGYYVKLKLTGSAYILPGDAEVEPCKKGVLQFVKYQVDPETVCRYTGLEDREGNKIWEHDLLEYSYEYPGSPWLKAKGLTDDDIHYKVGEVFFSEWRGTWAVCGRGRYRNTNQDVYKYSRNPNRTKVIGNIFDDLELLEKEG